MCKVGDVYMAKLNDDVDGCIQTGVRPVIIVSNDKANEYSPVITIIPLTSKMDKRSLPTHVYMANCGLSKPSIALAEQITSLNKTRLLKYLGNIMSTEYENKVRKAIEIQLNM